MYFLVALFFYSLLFSTPTDILCGRGGLTNHHKGKDSHYPSALVCFLSLFSCSKAKSMEHHYWNLKYE